MCFILGGALSSAFNFFEIKFEKVYGNIWKIGKYDIWKLKKKYGNYITIENGKIHHWCLTIKIYMIYIQTDSSIISEKAKFS